MDHRIKDRQKSARRLRKKKKSKYFEKEELSQPTKECRKGNHDKCPNPHLCPCWCHYTKDQRVIE